MRRGMVRTCYPGHPVSDGWPSRAATRIVGRAVSTARCSAGSGARAERSRRRLLCPLLRSQDLYHIVCRASRATGHFIPVPLLARSQTGCRAAGSVRPRGDDRSRTATDVPGSRTWHRSCCDVFRHGAPPRQVNTIPTKQACLPIRKGVALAQAPDSGLCERRVCKVQKEGVWSCLYDPLSHRTAGLLPPPYPGASA